MLERLPEVFSNIVHRNGWSFWHQLVGLSFRNKDTSLETFRLSILQELAEHGCYIDPCEDFTPKKRDLSSVTGVDFKTCTVYDAERAKIGVRRRNINKDQEVDVED